MFMFIQGCLAPGINSGEGVTELSGCGGVGTRSDAVAAKESNRSAPLLAPVMEVFPATESASSSLGLKWGIFYCDRESWTRISERIELDTGNR
jgi:hypothetical protein